MNNNLSNKYFYQLLDNNIVNVSSGFVSISIDNKEVNLSASLNTSTLNYKSAFYLGDNDEQTELTEDQHMALYDFLTNAYDEANDFTGVFTWEDQQHALSLIHS